MSSVLHLNDKSRLKTTTIFYGGLAELCDKVRGRVKDQKLGLAQRVFVILLPES